MKRHLFTLGVPLAGLLAILVLAIGSAAGAATPLSTYIIQLSDPPLASYRGGVVGLAPTSPTTLGTVKLDPSSVASKAYLNHLNQKQTSFRTALPLALGRPVDVPFSYRYAYDGVAAVLRDSEAATVAGMPGVVHVEKQRTLQLQTDVGPTWIGATSIWNGSASGGLGGTMGEGVVVGDIDTGINHDHP